MSVIYKVVYKTACFILLFTGQMEDSGGGHWLVWMEWRPAGLSMCLPLLISPCTMKSRSSLLAPAHPGGPGERAVKCGVVVVVGFPMRAGGVMHLDSFVDFDAICMLLLVCLASPTYFLFSLLIFAYSCTSLLIFSFENRPAPFPG